MQNFKITANILSSLWILKILNIHRVILYNSNLIWNESGSVLDGELLYTGILEVNLFAIAYRLFHEEFSPI